MKLMLIISTKTIELLLYDFLCLNTSDDLKTKYLEYIF